MIKTFLNTSNFKGAYVHLQNIGTAKFAQPKPRKAGSAGLVLEPELSPMETAAPEPTMEAAAPAPASRRFRSINSDIQY